MKINELIALRLYNQGLCKPEFDKPSDVVKWFCAIQAQDFLGSLWTIGQRINKSTESMVEQAIADRSIVRTWPMRGTLHFVIAEDVRWMLKLLTPRVIAKTKSIYKQQGLDETTFSKSRKIFEAILRDGKRLTRSEMYEGLERMKIKLSEQRGLHLIGHAAQQGLLCLGPRSGKQHTFVLLDEWIPTSKLLTKDQSLAELATRYFASHGPATMSDFSWWSGLTLSEVKKSIEIVGEDLQKIVVDSQEHWMTATESFSKFKSPNVHLLSWFDEYIIGYKDRSAAFDPKTEKHLIKPKNGLWSPVTLIDGKIAGSWKRLFLKNQVQFELKHFRKFTSKEENALDRTIQRFKYFVN